MSAPPNGREQHSSRPRLPPVNVATTETEADGYPGFDSRCRLPLLSFVFLWCFRVTMALSLHQSGLLLPLALLRCQLVCFAVLLISVVIGEVVDPWHFISPLVRALEEAFRFCIHRSHHGQPPVAKKRPRARPRRQPRGSLELARIIGRRRYSRPRGRSQSSRSPCVASRALSGS